MGHPIKVTAIALLAALSFSKTGGAAPIVSVDLDPSTPGIQSTRTVQQGDLFDIDIFISGVDPTPLGGLQVFQLQLDADPNLVSATAASAGSFFPLPLPPTSNIAGASIFILSGNLGVPAPIGDGVLAHTSWTADAAGTISFSLSNLLLIAPPDSPIAVGGINTATLTIESGPSQLSAPPALALLLLGGLTTWVAARRHTNKKLS